MHAYMHCVRGACVRVSGEERRAAAPGGKCKVRKTSGVRVVQNELSALTFTLRRNHPCADPVSWIWWLDVSVVYPVSVKALAGAVLTPLMIVFRMPALALGALRFVPQFFMFLLQFYQRLPADVKRSVNSFFAEAFMARRASERPTYGSNKNSEQEEKKSKMDDVDAEDQTWRQRKEFQERERQKMADEDARDEHRTQQGKQQRQRRSRGPRQRQTQHRDPDDFGHEFPWEAEDNDDGKGTTTGTVNRTQRKAPGDFADEFPWEAEEEVARAQADDAAKRRRELRSKRRKRARPANNKDNR